MQSSVDDSEMDLSGLGLQESLVDSDDEEVYNEHNEVSTGILYFVYFCMILLISFQVLSNVQYILKLFTWVTPCYLSYSSILPISFRASINYTVRYLTLRSHKTSNGTKYIYIYRERAVYIWNKVPSHAWDCRILYCKSSNIASLATGWE